MWKHRVCLSQICEENSLFIEQREQFAENNCDFVQWTWRPGRAVGIIIFSYNQC